MDNQTLKVLMVTASARQAGSVTRRFADEMLDKLREQYAKVDVQHRDVSQGMLFVDENWVNANFTGAEQRTDAQKALLSHSDALVAEIQNADVLILAAPIYNFSVPATLKAWIDQVARVGLTFNYTANGPVGKLSGKKAYVVMASGGTEIGSPIDFASGYLRHVLGFIGINDVSLISADRFNQDDEQAIVNIRAQINEYASVAA